MEENRVLAKESLLLLVTLLVEGPWFLLTLRLRQRCSSVFLLPLYMVVILGHRVVQHVVLKAESVVVERLARVVRSILVASVVSSRHCPPTIKILLKKNKMFFESSTVHLGWREKIKKCLYSATGESVPSTVDHPDRADLPKTSYRCRVLE